MSSSITTTPTVSASSISPSDTGAAPPGGGGGTSNSLYLFTFLTTLLLLLAVSCGIVLRSFILRRRFRRRVEEAIAAGVLRPEHLTALGSRSGTVLGDKPKMWEVWIRQDEKEAAQQDWKDIMPVAATIVPGDKTGQTTAPTTSQPAPTRRLFGILPARAKPSTLPSTSSDLPPSTAVPTKPDSLEVTVLIAMPTPHRAHHHHAEASSSSSAKGKDRCEAEEELPEVVFGVAEMSWKAGAEWKPPGSENQDGSKEVTSS